MYRVMGKDIKIHLIFFTIKIIIILFTDFFRSSLPKHNRRNLSKNSECETSYITDIPSM